MVYMNNSRIEYVAALSAELDKLGAAPDEKSEILGDFSQHFEAAAAQGLSEAQVCEKLGDVREIARQYAASEESEPVNPIGFTGETTAAERNRGSGKFSVGGLIGAVCLDVFAFSWAIPALFAVVMAYYSLVAAFATAGLLMLIPSALVEAIETSFHPVSVLLLGISFIALGGLGVILGLTVGRGFVSVIKSVINLHGEWIVGRKVFPPRRNQEKEVST
jgi:uncharacterized membrane protein